MAQTLQKQNQFVLVQSLLAQQKLLEQFPGKVFVLPHMKYSEEVWFLRWLRVQNIFKLPVWNDLPCGTEENISSLNVSLVSSKVKLNNLTLTWFLCLCKCNLSLCVQFTPSQRRTLWRQKQQSTRPPYCTVCINYIISLVWRYTQCTQFEAWYIHMLV